MQDLKIDEGKKKFSINGDATRIIEFNPSDINMIKRFDEARKNIEKIRDNIDANESDDTEVIADIVSSVDTKIKEQIDYIFDYPVSNVVFGATSAMATVKGVLFFERFLNAVQPHIESEIKKEQKLSQERISKYTDKYPKKK